MPSVVRVWTAVRKVGRVLPFTEPVGHVCGCNVCVGCVLRPGSHCASAITGYPERKESMGGGGREWWTGLYAWVKWIEMAEEESG